MVQPLRRLWTSLLLLMQELMSRLEQVAEDAAKRQEVLALLLPAKEATTTAAAMGKDSDAAKVRAEAQALASDAEKRP